MKTEHNYECCKLEDLQRLLSDCSSNKRILVNGSNDVKVIINDADCIEFLSFEKSETDAEQKKASGEKESVKEAPDISAKESDAIPVQQKPNIENNYGRPVTDEELKKMPVPPSWYIDAVSARKARIMGNLNHKPSDMYPKQFALKQDAFLNELKLLMRRYGYNKETVLFILSGKKKWRKELKKSLHLHKILKKNRKNQQALTKMRNLQKKAMYNNEFYKIPQ